MQQSSHEPAASRQLTPADLALVQVLQTDPRMSWARVGALLDIDAVTAMRRWRRLETTGRAWTAATPGYGCAGLLHLTFIEVEVAAGRLDDVAGFCARLPHVLTAEGMSGRQNLLLTAVTPDLPTLHDLLEGRIAAHPGATAVRAHHATRVFTEGSRWTVCRTAPARDARCRPAALPPEARGCAGDAIRTLLPLLSTDARTDAAALAREAGVSPATARRRLAQALGAREITLRCDVARSLTDWPVSAKIWARIPPDRLTEAACRLSALAEVRLCAAVTGRENLLVTLWLRSVEELLGLTEQIAKTLPRIQLANVEVALRQYKRAGRLVGPHDLSLGAVPIDPCDELATRRW
ncbi:Lrp/AsnC family transcriptional regulator [Streptomyces celluloflavus]|uniref:Lrp/AsnC family transcriptional regulator n=1 Tax=Streptomyces celluloflavus TaxID=58344 RepID=UPI0036910DDD